MYLYEVDYMMFYFKNYRTILFVFLCVGCFLMAHILQASAAVSSEEKIDAAMIRLGQLQEKFQNVGALFKVETEFSGFEPRLTFMSNVCYLEGRRCVSVMNAEYDESQKYRVGFKLNDGKFSYYDIFTVDKKEVNQFHARSSGEMISTNVMFFTLTTEAGDLTGASFSVDDHDEDNTPIPLTCVGFDINICSPFTFDGMRRTFSVRAIKRLNDIELEYLPFSSEYIAGDVGSGQILSYQESLSRKEFGGFIFNGSGLLMGWFYQHIRHEPSVLVDKILSLLGVGNPRLVQSLMHVQFRSIVEEGKK